MKCRWFSGLWLVGAIAILLSGCSHDPNVRKQKYLESGERYLEKGKYPEAIIQFANAVQVDPRFAEAHYQLGRAYLKTQDWAHAYQELTRTLELEPEKFSAHFDIASLLIAGSDFSQAKEHVDWVLAKQPDNPQSHSLLASWHAAQEDFASAVKEMQKAVVLDPGKSESYLNLGLLQLKTKQPGPGEASLKKAVELAPKALGAHMALGGLYQALQRYPESEQQFREATQIEPQNPDPRAALARVYMQDGKQAETVELLQSTKRDLGDNSAGYRMLGDFYFAVGAIDKATQEYASLYHDHPKDPLVKKNYVQLLILNNRLDEASTLNDEILKQSPNDAEALVYRGQIQIRAGHPDQAVGTLQAAIQSDSSSGAAYYHLGVALDLQGNWQQAEEAWRNAVRLRPDMAEAYGALAAAMMRKDDMTELEKIATQLISLQPTSFEGYALRALSLTRRGVYERAEVDVQKTVTLAPKNPSGYVQLGNLRSAQHKYQDAEKAYQQALELDAGAEDALKGLVETYQAQGRPDKAIAAIRAQIAKAPNSSAFYDLLGTTLYEQKGDGHDLGEAEAAFQKAADLDPRNADALFKLAQVETDRGSTDKALALCQHFLAANPRVASFYVLAGRLYESKQQLQEARDSYQKALEVEPENALASNNLAYVLAQTGGNLDEALSLAQLARRRMPDSHNVADTMGWVLFRKGVYGPAIRLFQEALKLEEKNKESDDPTVHYHLGLTYQKTGQNSLARQHLERVLKIDPNYSSSAEVRKLLAELQG